MANLKDIRKRIVTVKNTQKITRVMTMISASKLHKAKQVISQSRPYHLKIKEIFFSLMNAPPQSLEEFTKKKDQGKCAVLLLTSDRGLCGAFNSGLCKKLSSFLENKEEVDLFVIGKKGKDFFQSNSAVNILEGYYKKKEEELKRAISDLAEFLFSEFVKNTYNEIYVAFNYFVSSITQKPEIQQFLPLEIKDQSKLNKQQAGVAIFEPSQKTISNEILPVYLENLCYLCLLDSFAGEHASRMRVMDAATNNARDLITQLQTQYNRARQANITTELTEIISGAESV